MKEHTYIDKSEWTKGPWQHEPDHVEWKDENTGLPCMIHRGPSGALCGYVGVPASHKFYEESYYEPDVDVHGGLTYADKCQHGPAGESICHVPEPGDSDDVWWLGFDCAHAGDVCPKYTSYHECHSYGAYRDLDYVKNEVTCLASQLDGGPIEDEIACGVKP